MYKLEIKLVQHTPLIHFQSDQEESTLRASEVKPGLDRFILTKLGGDDRFLKELEGEMDLKKNNPLYAVTGYERGYRIARMLDWLSGNGKHPALNYKMNIFSPSSKCEDIERRYIKDNGREAKEPNPLFFANMGGNREDKKCYKRDPEGCILKFFFFNAKLREYLSDHLAEFFALNNFGTRNDKGFGSYYIASGEEGYKDIAMVLPKGIFYIEIPSADENAIWAAIDYYYRRLKSGIHRVSRNGVSREGIYPYQRSFLRLNSPTVHWEKEWMKIKFLGGSEVDDHKEFVFLRAILGLPGSFTFRPGNLDKDGTQSVEDEYGIEVSNGFVERIPSPLVFKVIKEEKGTKVYIVVKEMDAETYNEIKEFVFEFKPKFKFNYWKFDRDGRKIPRRNGEGFEKTFEMIPAGRELATINPLKIENSIESDGNTDTTQVERLEIFLERCQSVGLRLPETQVSIGQLLTEYHKVLNNNYIVNYKTDPRVHKYSNVKAKIGKL